MKWQRNITVIYIMYKQMEYKYPQEITMALYMNQLEMSAVCYGMLYRF